MLCETEMSYRKENVINCLILHLSYKLSKTSTICKPMYIMSNANKNYKLILSKPKLKLPLEQYNHKKLTLDFCLGIKMEYKLVHVVEK